MANLNKEQIESMVDALSLKFRKKTGLVLDKATIVNSLKAVSAENAEQNYKNMYKNVLLNTLTENKKNLVNPAKRTMPSKNDSNYKSKLDIYYAGAKNDSENIKKNSKLVAAEYEAMMQTFYKNVYATLLNDKKAPVAGGLTDADLKDITEAAHVDTVKYQLDYDKFHKVNNSTDKLLNMVNTAKNTRKDFDYSPYDYDVPELAVVEAGLNCQPEFHTPANDTEKIAAYFAEAYMVVKAKYDSRNFLSKLFSFKDRGAMKAARAELRNLLPNGKNYSQKQLESLMQSSLDKKVSEDWGDFEKVSANMKKVGTENLDDSLRTYNGLAKDSIKKFERQAVPAEDLDLDEREENDMGEDIINTNVKNNSEIVRNQ